MVMWLGEDGERIEGYIQVRLKQRNTAPQIKVHLNMLSNLLPTDGWEKSVHKSEILQMYHHCAHYLLVVNGCYFTSIFCTKAMKRK